MSDDSATAPGTENTPVETPFEKKMREKKEAGWTREVNGAKPAQANSSFEVPADHVPALDSSGTKSAYQVAVDEAVDGITLQEVYQRLSKNKYKYANDRDKTTGDGILVSCPLPGHEDTNPSAAINPGKGKGGVGTCYACAAGFDKFIVAGLAYGIDPKDDFNRLNVRMAEGLRGVHEPLTPALPPMPVAPVVVAAPGAPTGDAEPRPAPHSVVERATTYDWRQVLRHSPNAENTFLWAYCDETEKDTTPTEFNLFNGILAVGLVAGNSITSDDVKDLSANFGMCFVADSGSGKTRSTSHVISMLERIVPEQPNGTGVHILGSIFSGQAVISCLNHVEDNISNTTAPAITVDVHALLEYPELSELMGASGQQGSILKDKILDVLDHKPKIRYGSQGMGVKIIAHNPFGSIVTTTQPKLIRKLLSKDDMASGFMNRFMFFMGTEKRQLARGKIRLDLSRADGLLVGIHVHTGKALNMPWTDEADEYWEKVFREKVVPLKTEDAQDILTRLDLNLKRLILAFAVNDMSSIIERHHVQMAEDLIPYLVKCYERVIGALLMTENRELSAWLLEKIEAQEKSGLAKGLTGVQACPSQADLKRLHKGRWEEWLVTRALKELVEAGILNASGSTGTRGQKTPRYQVCEYGL